MKNDDMLILIKYFVVKFVLNKITNKISNKAIANLLI
jgi:hypothetical protein